MLKTVLFVGLAVAAAGAVTQWMWAERVVCAVGSDGESVAADGASKDACCVPPKKAGAKASVPIAAAAESAGVPVVCTLTGPEARERLDVVRNLVANAATDITRGANSVTVTFAEGHAADVLRFVELERACCPFFSFTLDFPAGKPMQLTVVAPKGGEAMLQGLFSKAE